MKVSRDRYGEHRCSIDEVIAELQMLKARGAKYVVVSDGIALHAFKLRLGFSDESIDTESIDTAVIRPLNNSDITRPTLGRLE